MKLLVLGGTAWLGAEIVRSALAAGHAVTCLARGSQRAAPDGARWVSADRTQPGAYEAVCAERWDAVIDVSMRPGQVRGAVAALREVCDRYAFVSSVSAYADLSAPGTDERAPLQPAHDADEFSTAAQYGGAKVRCEQLVVEGVGDGRALIVRPGLIGGPGDASDRTGYWPWRHARAAQDQRPVLVPEAAELRVQIIDARDLAHWIVAAAAAGTTGVFNAVGESRRLAEVLALSRRLGGHTGAQVAAPADWLLAQGVSPFAGPKSLPLWIPHAEAAGMGAVDASAARRAGLRLRPLEDTLRDTLAWELARTQPTARRAGLSDADEAALLAALEASRR